MTLLYTARKMMGVRKLPELSKKIWAELAALDLRILESEDFIEEIRIPADALAADTWEKAIFKAPDGGLIKDVTVIPDSSIGQATNYMTLDVQDKGANGSATDSIGSLAVNSSNVITGMVGTDLVTSNAAIATDRVISLKKSVTLAGQVFPGGLVKIRFTRT